MCVCAKKIHITIYAYKHSFRFYQDPLPKMIIKSCYWIVKITNLITIPLFLCSTRVPNSQSCIFFFKTPKIGCRVLYTWRWIPFAQPICAFQNQKSIVDVDVDRVCTKTLSKSGYFAWMILMGTVNVDAMLGGGVGKRVHIVRRATRRCYKGSNQHATIWKWSIGYDLLTFAFACWYG